MKQKSSLSIKYRDLDDRFNTALGAVMLGITVQQYRVLEVYGFYLENFSHFDWTFFDRYTPDEFRQAFPEYYV